MDMTIKGTNSNWSFRTPGLGRTSAQFCYTTPLFLSFTCPSIRPHSWYVIRCVKGEKYIHNPHLQNN